MRSCTRDALRRRHSALIVPLVLHLGALRRALSLYPRRARYACHRRLACVVLFCAGRSTAGLDPVKMVAIDNSCPDDATQAGASAAEASKEKLEWKDVFELTEWFRPGTIKKSADFDPTKM